MRRIRWRRIILVLLVVLALALGAVTLLWTGSIADPSPAAQEALQSDEVVRVTQESDLVLFEPANASPAVGLALYSGGGVDFRAYAPPAREVAARGYAVVLLRAPLGLAFFGTNAADRARAALPAIDRWAVGGHSLGGVVAAGYAASHADVRGLALWASYPANDDLATTDLAVISVYGTEDGLTTLSDIDRSREQLPPDTRFVEIAGANHAQFGAYGPQDGDRPATIEPEVQWALVAEATASLLGDLAP